jgi:hypothetical protein
MLDYIRRIEKRKMDIFNASLGFARDRFQASTCGTAKIARDVHPGNRSLLTIRSDLIS